MKQKYHQLTSFAFITCLCLLLVNDLILKSHFHNYLTGKLSDFCGLFVFAVFWAVMFPGRKETVFFSTALLFIVWKSPFSQGFIDVFSHSIFPIMRVVDISDLIALLVLPLAWKQLAMPQAHSIGNPWIAGVLTVFSFCATSIRQPVQEFEQPQYILLESPDFSPDTVSYDDDQFTYYRSGRLLVIRVKSIRMENYPAKEDDFQKNLVLNDLDERVIREINLQKDGYYRLSQPLGEHRLVIDSAGQKDSLRFIGSRLNGQFTRIDSTGKRLISGQYKQGIEDSVWVFADAIGSAYTQKTFKNGEAIRSVRYENGEYLSSKKIATRADTVRNKYFQLLILSFIAMGLVRQLVRNYRNTPPAEVQYTSIEKTLYPVAFPCAVAAAIHVVGEFTPDAYSAPFQFVGDIFFSIVIALPLFLLLFFTKQIRKRIDLLWYVLLFAIGFALVREFNQLNHLKNQF